MNNETKNISNFTLKMKSYCAGIALITLICASDAYGMLASEEGSNQIDKKSRIRCLWNLEQNVYRVAALESQEEMAFQENDSKLRVNYLKKLGEFLKHNPGYALDLKILKSEGEAKALEDSPLADFYKKTRELINQTTDISQELRDFQLLKLDTFYNRLTTLVFNTEPEGLKSGINKMHNVLLRKPSVDMDKLKYFKNYYIAYNEAVLQDLANQSSGKIWGKINFLLGQNISNKENRRKEISIKEAYYVRATKGGYSLAKYHLAELYNTNTDEYREEGFYKPEEAYNFYAEAAREGNALAAYKLANFIEAGDPSFDLDPDPEDALLWYRTAAKNGHPYAQYVLSTSLFKKDKSKEGLVFLKQAAESGYSKAQLKFGEHYDHLASRSLFIQVDLPQLNWRERQATYRSYALKWYQKAADQGTQEAYYFLGRLYEVRSESDYEKAFAAYSQSEDPRAYVRLGQIYLEGLAGTQSEELALAQFKQAAEKENADGQYYVGLMNLQGKAFPQPNLEAAVEHFISAAAQDHSKALLQLGLMHQFGVGVTQSYTEAVSFYERAKNKNSHLASYYLGELYDSGLGTEQDTEKAFTAWDAAAGLGFNGNAYYKVGKIHLQSYFKTGEETNAEDAHGSLRCAIEQTPPHIDALYLLGVLEQKAIGCEKDAIQAMKNYEQASSLGHASAQFKLGKFYAKMTTPDDHAKAVGYFHQAAEQYHIEARLALGNCYLKGRGVSKDPTKAFQYLKGLDHEISVEALSLMKELVQTGHEEAITWFQEKAQAGNPHAQYFLGKLLEKGLLMPQDMAKAIELYQQAAKWGKRAAYRRLEDLRQTHLFPILSLQEGNNSANLEKM